MQNKELHEYQNSIRDQMTEKGEGWKKKNSDIQKMKCMKKGG